jgi:hypothetical protein
MLSVTYSECHFKEFKNLAEGHYKGIFMLNVTIQNAMIQNVIIQNVIKQNVIIQNIIRQKDIIQNVIVHNGTKQIVI